MDGADEGRRNRRLFWWFSSCRAEKTLPRPTGEFVDGSAGQLLSDLIWNTEWFSSCRTEKTLPRPTGEFVDDSAGQLLSGLIWNTELEPKQIPSMRPRRDYQIYHGVEFKEATGECSLQQYICVSSLPCRRLFVICWSARQHLGWPMSYCTGTNDEFTSVWWRSSMECGGGECLIGLIWLLKCLIQPLEKDILTVMRSRTG